MILQLFKSGTVSAQDCRTCSSSKLDVDHYYHDDKIENRPITPLVRPPNGNSISHPGSLVAPVDAMPRHMARQMPPTPPTSSTSSTSSSSSSSAPSSTTTSSAGSFKLETGAIVGIAVGSAILISLLFMSLAAFRRRLRRSRKRPQGFVPSAAFYASQDQFKSDDHQYPPQIPMTQPESGSFPVTTPTIKDSRTPDYPPNLTELEAGTVRSEWTT